jgi:diacylglycerol kinase family enzyme
MFKPGEGNITESPAVQEYHSTWLKVHTEPGTPVHSDGEVFEMDIQDFEYQILPGVLPTLIP